VQQIFIRMVKRLSLPLNHRHSDFFAAPYAIVVNIKGVDVVFLHDLPNLKFPSLRA
jgi:hypothetical protein